MHRTPWFERHFPSIEDNGRLPGILERLEGTPHRLTARFQSTPELDAVTHPAGTWSLRQEIGHLGDLEPLWTIRMQQIIHGESHLMVADLSNTQTHQSDHDAQSVAELIQRFAVLRTKTVTLLRSVRAEELEHVAIHPRLGTPMRLIDLAYFVAEHDDHHLAQITALQPQSATER